MTKKIINFPPRLVSGRFIADHKVLGLYCSCYCSCCFIQESADWRDNIPGPKHHKLWGYYIKENYKYQSIITFPSESSAMKISNFIIKINTISKMYGQANKVMNLNLSISIILFIHVLICTTETVNTYLTFFYPVKEIL